MNVKERGKVVVAYPLNTSDYCGSKGNKHDWRVIQLAHGVWLDRCDDCPYAALIITERAEQINPKNERSETDEPRKD